MFRNLYDLSTAKTNSNNNFSLVPYIIGIVLGSLLIASFALILIIKWIKNFRKEKRIKEIGRTAEDMIGKDLKLWAEHSKFKFIGPSLLFLDKDRTKTFEVDSIVITSKMIICVEIKSIKGIIKGDANESNWSKIMENNQEIKHPIRNPISQNKAHIDNIIKILGKQYPIVSLVVFSDRTTMLDVSNVPGWCIVIKHSQLFETLDEINNSNLPIRLLRHERNEVYEVIKKCITNKGSDFKKHLEHIKTIKEIETETKNA